MPASNATVYVVDKEATVRETLQEVSRSRGYTVFTYSNAEDFLNDFDASLLCCILIGLELPTLSGFELQQELLQLGSRPPILIMNGRGNIAHAVKAIKNGAIDYIEKPIQPLDVIEKIDDALEQEVRRRVVVAQEEKIQQRFAELTDREWDVLRSMLEGPTVLSSKGVAKDLGLSPRTVEHHRRSIMKKTDTVSMADLTKLASLAGIIMLRDTIEEQ